MQHNIIDTIMKRIYNMKFRDRYTVMEVRVLYSGADFCAEIDLANYAGTALGYGHTPEDALINAESKILYLTIKREKNNGV